MALKTIMLDLKAFAILAILTLAASTLANAAEQGCKAYSAYRKLPQRFVEIASGSLSAGTANKGIIEFSVVSDGICTCASAPSILHHSEVNEFKGVWTCRAAADGEKESP